MFFVAGREPEGVISQWSPYGTSDCFPWDGDSKKTESFYELIGVIVIHCFHFLANSPRWSSDWLWEDVCLTTPSPTSDVCKYSTDTIFPGGIDWLTAQLLLPSESSKTIVTLWCYLLVLEKPIAYPFACWIRFPIRGQSSISTSIGYDKLIPQKTNTEQPFLSEKVA